MTAHIINASGNLTRPVKVEDLLPAEFRGPPQTADDIIRELAEKQRRFEKAYAARKAKLKLVGKKPA